MKKLVLGGIIIVAAVVLVFVGDGLRYNPLSCGVNWNYPRMLVAGKNGEMAVLNEYGSQVVLLDGSDRVTGIIKAGLKKTEFRSIGTLAVADDSVYVADLNVLGGGAYASGMRVARFSFTGEYLGTVYEEKFEEPIYETMTFAGMSYSGGKIYGVGKRNDKLTVMEVVNGKKRNVRAIDQPYLIARGGVYSPEDDVGYALTGNGRLFRTQGDKPFTQVKLSHAYRTMCLGDGGVIYASDLERKRLYRIIGGREEPVAEGTADRMMVLNDRLYCCNYFTQQLFYYDLKTSKRTDITHAQASLRFAMRCRVAWIALLALVGAVIFALSIVVRKMRAERKRMVADEKAADRPLGMSALYMSNMVLILLAFGVVTMTITVNHYQTLCSRMDERMQTVANAIKELSPRAFGDALGRISSSSHYGNDDYRHVMRMLLALCEQGKDSGSDLNFAVFRTLADGNIYCVMERLRLNCSVGDRLTEDEKNFLHIEEIAKDISQGKIRHAKLGDKSVTVVPLQDSQGTDVGVAVLMANTDVVMLNLLDAISQLSLDLLSQLLVLVMLFGEFKLLMRFWRLHEENEKAGAMCKTVCEGQRPIRVLQNVTVGLFMPFMPFIARDSACAAGLTSSIYFTLPLVLSQASYFIGRMTLQGISQRSPRRCYAYGCVGLMIVAGLLIWFVAGGGYWVFLFAVCLMEVANSLVGCANTSLRASGLKPSKEYRLLVFTNMEPTIGYGIGAAIGAFLYARFGMTTIALALVFVAVFILILDREFVFSDINAAKPTVSEDRKPAPVKGKSALKFVLSPFILTLVLCVTMPVSVMMSFQSYAFPLLNEEVGNSVIVVGFVMLIMQLLSLFLIPLVLKCADRIGDLRGSMIAAALIYAPLVVFAMSPSVLTMVIVVMATCLLQPVVATFAERLEIQESESSGVDFTKAVKYLIIGEGAACSLGPALFCWLMGSGYRVLGYGLLFAGLTLLAVYFVCLKLAGKTARAS